MTHLAASHPDQPAAHEHADVVVVGAGITGLATAVMLLDAGRRVTVLEQDVAGALASGRNTGKVSLLQGTRLSTIRRAHPARLVRAYVDGQLALDPAELVRGLAELVARGGGRLVTGVRALGVRAADQSSG